MYIKSADGSSIHYEKTVSGQPIILLHGLSGDHTIWSDTGWIDALSKKNQVVSIDLRGCGKSDAPETKEAYSIGNHIADIDAIITREKLGNPIVFGWSLGATLVTHIASVLPLAKAVMCGSYFGLLFTPELIERGIKNTDDPVLIARLKAFAEWPIVEPCNMKCPFFCLHRYKRWQCCNRPAGAGRKYTIE